MTRPLLRAVIGGAVGTALMTTMMHVVAPLMLGTSMDIADLLGWMTGGSWLAGMTVHFVNGALIFPALYSWVALDVLPGSPAVRGIVWGAVLWLVAQILVMPIAGAGLFSANIGGAAAAGASLMGHVVYGASLGLIAGGGNNGNDIG